MESVDVSTVATPDSSSSEVSQPTVKLRVNEAKYRGQRSRGQDSLCERSRSKHSFLLDRDGCQLIETTGRTAQRARATRPEGRPRKSRSTTSVGNRQKNAETRLRKRHSYGLVDSSPRDRLDESFDATEKTISRQKRYSAGDYLRQQILEDLNSNEMMGKSEREIAEDRCKRVKAYLRRRQEDGPYVAPEARLRELKNCWRDGETDRRNDLERIRAYLQEKIQTKMKEEECRWRETIKSSNDYPNELSMRDIRKRYSNYDERTNGDYAAARRGAHSETSDGKSMIRCRRTRSDVIPETVIDPDDNEVRKRFYSYSNERRDDSSKTKSRLTFETKLSLPSRSSAVDLEREISKEAIGREKNRRKYCRRTRSDTTTMPEKLLIQAPSVGRRSKRRSVSWSDKRKLHRRTNDKYNVPQTDDTSLDSDGREASVTWREYKEKRRMRKELANGEKSRRDDDSIIDRCEIGSFDGSKPSDADAPTKTNENTDETETETILQENYLLLEMAKPDNDLTISKLQLNEYRETKDGGSDVGYDTIPKQRRSEHGNWIEFNANSNVKKSDTFKIVDGSENTSSSFDRTIVRRRRRRDDSVDATSDISESVAPSNNDIARDYFRRVYDLLKQRQDEARRETRTILARGLSAGHDRDASSSSNSAEHEEATKRRRRRQKKDKTRQGEELVSVSGGVVGEDDWAVQRLIVNNDTSNLIFRRPQLHNVTGYKRPRHPAPPIPANCRINAKDISKYFDYPNKENSPRNGVNENRPSERNESIEKEEQQENENENEMGSNLSRHNGKGLSGRRTQSSGNLCDPKGKLNHVGKILVPCSSSQRERYKICGSLPNHLDDKEILEDEDARENNNVLSDTMVGNLGGTLPHKKRTLGVHFSDTGPTGTLDLVKHRSQDSLEGDPWRYQDGADLDLVRCKHGNFDLVRKNQSADVVDGDVTGKRYGTLGRTSNSKCHRGADLDLVGTLPKRRADESKGAVLRQSFESRPNRPVDRHDGDVSIKVMHKPDCELMKHRQFDRIVDLKLSRLAGGEPQDQGYASERSPEDEHPPSLPGQPFPNVTPESTFRVTLQKSSRGLGLSVSGGGTAGPVRVKRLFPQQPAALSNKLQPGDILLAANGVPLTGLTNYEALEVLRTTPSTVELVVCRLPGDASITPPGAPPPPPARREPPPPLRILNPLPPLHIEPCGEFDIEMTKVAGSLGFTLRKVDSSALGHYVRALVREPALSDGRIQPGDKIVAVDGAPLSPMSHEEAVALLRQCGPRVKLRLYRDLAQTPVSALSPTEPDHPLRPPRTSLRQEAVDMLCDLAVRKLSPGTSNGSNSRQTSATSCHSPRRLRKPLSRTPTADNDNESHLTFHPVHPSATSQADVSDSDQCSINTQATNSQAETSPNDIIDPPPLYDVCDSSDSSKAPPRPSFLDLTAPPEKPHFQFSLESESDNAGPMIVTESDSNVTVECDYDDDLAKEPPTVRSNEVDGNDLPSEPASMPPLLSATRTASGVFSYKNPAYQSANPTCGGIDNSAKNKAAHSSDQDIPGKVLGGEDPVGSKGLLKWKGVMFAPNDSVDETNGKTETNESSNECTTESATRHETSEDGNEVFMVELTRGWNSRLGFSLQPEGNSTVISVVHPDSVAAKDGRLKQGDVLIMVNDESVENMPTAEIIDLLRKIRGSIGITVMRTNKKKT